jgi:hypothetical protein
MLYVCTEVSAAMMAAGGGGGDCLAQVSPGPEHTVLVVRYNIALATVCLPQVSPGPATMLNPEPAFFVIGAQPRPLRINSCHYIAMGSPGRSCATRRPF